MRNTSFSFTVSILYTITMDFTRLFRQLAKYFSDDWRKINPTIGEKMIRRLGILLSQEEKIAAASHSSYTVVAFLIVIVLQKLRSSYRSRVFTQRSKPFSSAIHLENSRLGITKTSVRSSHPAALQ